MSRFQSIENELKSINGTVFQELCDSYLKLKNKNYLAFARTGSQVGKQKTTKGTPDSFFLLSNGNYLFVEITTDISTKNKLSNDILACFDFNKSKIPLNKIEEIILCINWNLDQALIFELNTLAKSFNDKTIIRFLMLQELAIELHFNHRDLAYEYLGLPFDTGQIVSIDKFIEEYNKASKGISTPINNTFLHREKELKDLDASIKSNDFVILTGAGGIGKTKLALEGITNFLKNNLSYVAYCVSYKYHTLLDDLYQYFDSEKNYILFVDDANRIDAFNQIIGFYKAIRKGQLKILITVRDYAFQEIGILCQEFSPKRLDLKKITDKQIIDIVKAPPFEILDLDYYKEIVRIADGNPRLAIMTALLVKAEQNISVLHDVSELFENYYSTFIKDNGEFNNSINIKCLGLIAFFHTIPYENKDVTTSILTNFEIEYSEFLEVIDKLNKLELIEIQFNTVKIPEQNLATYFFYKAFIKDNLLSFETILYKYFGDNSNRFRDCVIPANNTFGEKKVMNRLQPHLQAYWKRYSSKNENAFKFLSIFWYYLQSETLEFVFSISESLPTPTSFMYEVKYEKNAFEYRKNDVIELLGEFLGFQDNLKDAIELGFEYSRKKQEHLPEWINKIREKLSFDIIDETQFGFSRQITLFQILLAGLNTGDSLFKSVFYDLSKTFLSFKFNYAKAGRNNSLNWYYYVLPNISEIQDFRQKIWNAVEINYENNPENSFDLLLNYSSLIAYESIDLMQFDILFLIEIIEKHLSQDSFEHCRYIHDLIRWCKINSVSHDSFPSLTTKFTNHIYEIFIKIDWNRYRDKEILEFSNHSEYEELKEAEIRSSFVFKNIDEAMEFYNTFYFLKKATKNHLHLNISLDYIIDENCSLNFELGCQMLIGIINKKYNEVNYVPMVIFKNHLKTAEQTKRIWEIIQNQDFFYKRQWELAFYDTLDDSVLTEEYVQALLRQSLKTLSFDTNYPVLIFSDFSS